MITEKWHVKVLSLAAAVIISIFYRMNNLETRFFTIPLIIESNDFLLPANAFPSAIKISMRGESEKIQPILAEDIEAFIDLERYSSEGNYRVPVQIRKKGSALGVEPLEISALPVEIQLNLEQKITRNVDIFPIFRGTIADGYELADESLTPSSVTVEGPRSAFESHVEFATESIDLDKRYENFSVMVNIKNNNSLLNIHGNGMVEFHGTINRIAREEHENNDLQETEEELLPGGEQ